jgi:hypothetical protein
MLSSSLGFPFSFSLEVPSAVGAFIERQRQQSRELELSDVNLRLPTPFLENLLGEPPSVQTRSFFFG